MLYTSYGQSLTFSELTPKDYDDDYICTHLFFQEAFPSEVLFSSFETKIEAVHDIGFSRQCCSAKALVFLSRQTTTTRR
jgi:hypothetical protein